MKHAHSTQMPISKLLLMAALHFALMYALMYAMVDRFENVVPNLNQIYMAAVMTAPMLLLEGWLMGSMYDKRALLIVMGVSVLVFVAAFVGIRQQTAIGDAEFLRSMIPHHAGAVLMCEQAPIEDPEVLALCDGIIAGQQDEIEQMKAILERLEGQ